ncbi:tol-pal system protein YbgF [Maritimibacter sp. 55A14]|uniref:tol-pal system protein YbgF n=1 Tax=Maritimibacter sp. 55A14 TaxID=2174844 RepID=UPI000D605A12|nr:tol-pal system protein YbgF [Maritimibacter sp. 55A14]PWE29423.1 tol-pal system protein YbgF [Maritimibacter sp. 55A14]
MLRLAAVLLILLSAPLAAQSREETLADIRQEMSILHVEVQRLKRQLSTTGAPSVDTGGATMLDRVDRLESELRRLTARTEELEFRINRIVEDGTRRIGDLEFRLVELEGGDVSKLGETTTLGGEDIELPGGSDGIVGALPDTDTGSGDGPELAVGEKADFDAAMEAYDHGEYEAAAEAFRRFTVNYPGGGLSSEAHFWRGEAHAAAGDWSSAARAYLESFSGAPDGPMAPEALYKLGVGLDRIGQREEACLTLAEVPARFQGSEFAAEAEAEMSDLGCQ